jgi:type IV pilus assembly protein PilA
MLHKLRTRAQDEKGFTLIELLVVILIIGILAAIALPAFLGQRTKGQDSAAKSDARNMVSQLESFYTEGDTYVGGPGPDTGLEIGTSAGKVGVSGLTKDAYVITAYSKSKNEFVITRNSTGTVSRTCEVKADNNGGCNVTAGGTTGTW